LPARHSRPAEPSPESRQKASLEEFHAEAGGIVEVIVLRQARDGVGLLLAAAEGNPHAVALYRALGRWVSEIEQARPLCLNAACTHEFDAHDLPVGFLITLPYRDDAMHCLVSGFCSACAMANTDAAIILWLRQLWPDARAIDISRDRGRA
jgi:hypothetical protein